jgi:hypothetical protein
MDEGQHVDISPVSSHLFTSHDLLELAAWIEKNRAQLSQEAEKDETRNTRALSQDRADMEQIKKEWREQRTEGDETPPKPML